MSQVEADARLSGSAAMRADPRRGLQARAVHVAQRCAVAEVLIAKGFDARWRFNRDGSLRFGRPS